MVKGRANGLLETSQNESRSHLVFPGLVGELRTYLPFLRNIPRFTRSIGILFSP